MNRKTGFLKRYRGLVISLSVFVLLVIGLLGLTLYATREVGGLRNQLLASSQMMNSIQTITRDLYDMKLSWGEDPESPHMSSVLNRLERETQNFSELVAAFQRGGSVVLPGDELTSKTYIQAVADIGEVKEQLEEVQSRWEIFQPLITDYYSGARDIFSTELPLDLAVNESQISSVQIYSNLNAISEQLNEQANNTTAWLQMAQYIGMAVTLLYFIVFMMIFVRQLIRADIQAEESNRETDEIMDTVQEGLFLVDKELNVGSRQSRVLQNILPGVNTHEKTLADILHNILNERDVVDTQGYINMLFQKRVKESLTQSLNPLSRIQVFFDNGQGGVEDRYLKFNFNRVYENDEITRVLVSVTDITQEVNLEKRLENERKQNTRQIELLVKVLRVEPEILEGFMRNGFNATNRINEILRQPDSSQSALKAKTEEIFREIHSFKGESSALDFDQFVVLCQEMEDKLRAFRNKVSLSGDDFITIAVSLDSIIDQLNSLKVLQGRLRSHTASEAGDVSALKELATNSEVNQHIDSYLKHFADQVAQRNYKVVNTHVDGFDETPFNDETMDIIKSITVQLIRNAVVHGIESPEARKGTKKEYKGNVGIHLRKKDDFYDLIVEDDGQGIDVEAIREKLRGMNNLAKNPDEMTEAELYRAIFMSGLSTANGVSEDAGQGVGMDVVRDRIRSIGAKISINSKRGEFTRFVIRIPAPKK